MSADCLIVANWKMHGSQQSLREWLAAVLPVAGSLSATAVLCPPFPLLPIACDLPVQGVLKIGAQDVSEQSTGAFTGEVQAELLAECGCEMVIVGHSERRARHGEADSLIAGKARAARNAGLTPIICVGESAEARADGRAQQVVGEQLDGLGDVLGAPCVLAYEPIWAIGTGKSATISDIEQMHAWLRGRLPDCPLLYGGSVSRANLADTLALDCVDGALVGSASLDAEHFNDLLRIAG